jgi:hypothetical protein
MARKSIKKNAQTEISAEVLEPVLAVQAIETIAADELAALDAVLEVQVQEAQAEVQEDQAVLEVQAPQAEDQPQIAFGDLMKEVPEELVTKTMNLMKDRIADRRQMEVEKNSYNDNIHRTLKNVEQTMVRPVAAMVMVAASVSPNFIVEESRAGEHYNVYAMGKLNDLVDALAGLKLSNAINRAIVRSMFKLRDAGVTITREILECAASDKIRMKDRGVESLLVRHTVGASTAPTQTSSTLRALETLGIVKVTGSKQNTVVTLLDTPQTAALEQVANAMAA